MIRSNGLFFAFFAIGLSACAGFAPPPQSGVARSQRAFAPSPDTFVYRTLVDLTGQDGSDAVAAPIAVSKVLYGLTYSGGAYNDGVFYSLTPSGQHRVLHSFGWKFDGAQPFGAVVYDEGTFYGTTSRGGRPNGGTIVAMTNSGSERVVYAFRHHDKHDGYYPTGSLAADGGTLYGTTFRGGTNDRGTVFAVTPAGQETWLYSFGAGGDGTHPYAGLTLLNGTFYGTTTFGGANGKGTVFSVTTSGTENVLYSFGGHGDGAYPRSALVAVHGILYGTTPAGGANGRGSIYTITSSGKEQVLYSFAGPPKDGASPYAALTTDGNVLYGTTTRGGAYDRGTAYEVTTSGTESIVWAFGSRGGRFPYAGLTPLDGALYGATAAGGPPNTGTLFSLTPNE